MKKTIEFKLSLILTKEDMNRLRIKEKDEETEITADVHGMSVKRAKRFINNILNIVRTKVQLIIIHGYNHGTAIKDMLADQFVNEHIVEKYLDSENQGVTNIVAAA